MSEQQSNILLGYVSEVRGDGMIARMAEEHAPETPLIKVGDEEILAGHIGSYVVIRQAQIAVLAMVHKVW
ncbi:MAG: ATPase, partial [Methylococcales bacterium]|nr:ATPase [Methylococcales bacterium]